MKKYLVYIVCILVVCTIALSSCLSEVQDSETSYLPYRSSKDGRWGIIGMDGKVLLDEEFKDQPTTVQNGRFLVKNGNNEWEVYSTEGSHELIEGEFVSIADFTDVVTPATKKNGKICLIDTDCEVVTTLENISGKAIIVCSGFMGGLAAIKTEDGLWGVIDTKGDVVISPKYKDIYIISYNKIAGLKVKKDESDQFETWTILDNTNETITELKIGSGQKYTSVDWSSSTPDYIAVCSSVDGESHWGYIDYEKTVVVKPTGKIVNLGYPYGDKFIFSNGENCGVMNFKGEIILRARYDLLAWADDNLLIAYNTDTNYSLINLEGEKLTKGEYLDILPFYGGSYAAVKVDDNSWGFINRKGEEVKIKNLPDIYTIGNHHADMLVESDYVDIDGIVGNLKISKHGLSGYNLEMNPLQVVKQYNEQTTNEDVKAGLTPEENLGMDCFETTYSKRGIEIASSIYYSLGLIEYMDDSLAWTSKAPTYIEAKVSGDVLKEKADVLYLKIASSIKSYGKVMRENSHSLVVQLSQEQGWVIAYSGTEIYLKLFNTQDYQYFNIDNFAKPNETTRVYIKPKFYQSERADGYSRYDSSPEERMSTPRYNRQENEGRDRHSVIVYE